MKWVKESTLRIRASTVRRFPPRIPPAARQVSQRSRISQRHYLLWTRMSQFRHALLLGSGSAFHFRPLLHPTTTLRHSNLLTALTISLASIAVWHLAHGTVVIVDVDRDFLSCSPRHSYSPRPGSRSSSFRGMAHLLAGWRNASASYHTPAINARDASAPPCGP